MNNLVNTYPGLKAFWEEMKETPQNPLYHGEGNVWNHTRLVTDRLKELAGYRALEKEAQETLLLAAALHDCGKSLTTRMEDGNWVSPHHAQAGAQRARAFLWKEAGLCRDRKKQLFREAVCSLIRFHSLPVHLIEREDGEHIAARFAESPATLEQLCLLAEADVLGRMAMDLEELILKIRLAQEQVMEQGIWKGPMEFASMVTKRAWFAGRKVQPAYPLYDSSWGEVIPMSGLAGTGKDTWIRSNCDLPMISLDEVRRQMKIRPSENQLPVVKAAREQAKEYLRKKQPFVWNATDLTQRVRGEQIDLFERYGASVHIVYLETDWMTNLRQNENRADAVPAAVLEKMLSILEPPMAWEAEKVSWIHEEG